jgi:integrase/recombinase XerD
MLEEFVGFLEQAGAQRITTNLALMWSTSTRAHPHWHRRRLGLVRGFARYQVPDDDRPRMRGPVQGPPAGPPPAGRAIHLLAGGDRRADRRGGRAATAAASAASPEADRALVRNRSAAQGARPRPPGRQPRRRALHVRASKQNKQREVPLHETTTAAVHSTPGRATAAFPIPPRRRSSIGARGGRVRRQELNQTFATLIKRVGLEGRGRRARPRPHDARHYADGWVMRPARSFGLVRALSVGILSA